MTAFLLLALLTGTPKGGDEGILSKTDTLKPGTSLQDSLKAEKPEISGHVKSLNEALKEDSTRVLPEPLPGRRKIKGIKKRAVVLKKFTVTEKVAGKKERRSHR